MPSCMSSPIVLLCGFAAKLSREPKSGLGLLLIAFMFITVVNLHDLLAQLAGLDFRLSLFAYDAQLALVEFAASLLHILGCLCSFLGILFLFIQGETGYYGYYKLERQTLSVLNVGPALLGSFLNSCQISERASGHMQILHESVHILFLMGSLQLLVEAIECGAAPLPLSVDKTIDVQSTIDIMDHFLACETTWRRMQWLKWFLANYGLAKLHQLRREF